MMNPTLIKNKIALTLFRVKNRRKATFECPICRYMGPLADVTPYTGIRKHARCPNCGSLERHRLQYVVLQSVLNKLDSKSQRILHFAPEACLRDFFKVRFGSYESADFFRDDVDHRVDIQSLPFADASYDFVFASHVLEHIPDDQKAIQEIRRVLKPGGIAVLPVPIVARETVEYPAGSAEVGGHVRAPGPDYFDRYRQYFSRVDCYASDTLPIGFEKYQLYVYEDRSQWPLPEFPLRTAMPGDRHVDIVPVCYA